MHDASAQSAVVTKAIS